MSDDITLNEAKRITAKLEAIARIFLDNVDSDTKEIKNKGILTQLEELSDSLSPTKISFISMGQKKEYKKTLEDIDVLLTKNRESLEEMLIVAKTDYITEIQEIGEKTLNEWLEPAAADFEARYEKITNLVESLNTSRLHLFFAAAAGSLLGGAFIGFLMMSI